MSDNPYCAELPEARLEHRYARQKPLLDDVQARAEAARCLFCFDAPCTKACPAGIDVPRFVWSIHTENARGAARAILEKNVLAVTCANVCPVPDQCEGACVLNHAGQPPVAIARLQRYATDAIRAAGIELFEKAPPTGRRVALVGAGPASLAAAHELTLRGHACDVFERRHMPGGLGTFAMAPYKITTDEVLDEVRWVERVGFDVYCGTQIGVDRSFASLLSEYDAVFLGVGLGADTSLEVPDRSDDPEGVVGALELIGQIKTADAAEMSFVAELRDVVVIGGGSTAMDAARELTSLGVPHVTVAYRRSEDEMPSYAHERAAARQAGAVIRHLVAPIDYLTDARGRVAGLKVARCTLGEADASGRRRPVPLAGAEEILPAQMVVLALGQERPREIVRDLDGVAVGPDGCVATLDETGRTGNPKVFAAGDCVNGGREVVHAVASGRRAAGAIDELLRKGVDR
jgi:glutamate synthase (NADPH/NADH) small chain